MGSISLSFTKVVKRTNAMIEVWKISLKRPFLNVFESICHFSPIVSNVSRVGLNRIHRPVSVFSISPEKIKSH